jgi:hypothetical protein
MRGDSDGLQVLFLMFRSEEGGRGEGSGEEGEEGGLVRWGRGGWLAALKAGNISCYPPKDVKKISKSTLYNDLYCKYTKMLTFEILSLGHVLRYKFPRAALKRLGSPCSSVTFPPLWGGGQRGSGGVARGGCGGPRGGRRGGPRGGMKRGIFL